MHAKQAPAIRILVATIAIAFGHRLLPAQQPSRVPVDDVVVPHGHAGHFAEVLAFSPDGNTVLTATYDWAILWDLAAGQELRRFPCNLHAALSPDGRKLITATRDNTAIVWDTRTGERLLVLQAGQFGVDSLAFSPDGGKILLGASTVDLWDATTGERLQSFDAFLAAAAVFTPDGRSIVTILDEDAVLWDCDTGKKVRTFAAAEDDDIASLAISPDGALLVTGSSEGAVTFWDLASGNMVRTIEAYELTVHSVAFSPDGRHVITGSGDGWVTVWNVQSGEEVLVSEREGAVECAVFSPTNQSILITDWAGTSLCDAVTGNHVRTLAGRTHDVSRMVATPDGARVVTCAHDGTAIVWDMVDGRKHYVFAEHDGGVTAVGISADGQRVLTASRDGLTIVWNADNGETIRTLQGEKTPATVAALSPNGELACVVWRSAHSSEIWNLASGEKSQTLKGHRDTVGSAAFSPDSKQVLTGGTDRNAIVWDVSTGSSLRVLRRAHEAGIWALAFRPDGQRIVTGSTDGTILLSSFDGADQLPAGRRPQVGHADSVEALAFRPDGEYVVSGSMDRTAILLDATRWDRIRTFEGHADGIHGVTFVSGGKQVLTGSEDGTIRLWDTATAKELCRLIALDYGDEWVVLTPDGLYDGSELGRQIVKVRVGEGNDLVPLEHFADGAHEPGLLHRILTQGDQGGE